MTQAISDLIDTIFGFRKFILMLAIYAVGIVFRVQDRISGGDFVELMKSTTIAFFAANGAEHFTTMAKSYIQGKVLNRSNPKDIAAAIIPPAGSAPQ